MLDKETGIKIKFLFNFVWAMMKNVAMLHLGSWCWQETAHMMPYNDVFLRKV